MDLLLPPSYFGSVNYFVLLKTVEKVYLDQHSHFEKQTIRNRCEILGANGKLKLIVPLKKWNNHTIIQDVRIDNSFRWKHIHWRSLMSAYRNSPYFEYYEDRFAEFYNHDFDFLLDLDLASTRHILDLLKMETEIILTDSFIPNKQNISSDKRPLFSRKTANDSLKQPTYIQVFSDRFPFASNLSILDLLFNLGPKTAIYLQNLNGNQPKEIVK
jgi:hypothetical protein